MPTSHQSTIISFLNITLFLVQDITVGEINTGVGKCEVYFDVGKYDIIRYLEKSVKNYDVATCVKFI